MVSIHLFCIISVNFFGLRHFNEKIFDGQLNPAGKKIVRWFNGYGYPNAIQKSLDIYTNYTGTSIGNEFFSPNVSSIPAKFLFVTDKGETRDLPLTSAEGKVKSMAAVFFYSSSLERKGLSDSIMKSLTFRLLGTNEQVRAIDAYMSFCKMKRLDSSQRTWAIAAPENIHLFTISRNN